jgi:hypothetical protein
MVGKKVTVEQKGKDVDDGRKFDILERINRPKRDPLLAC